MSTLPIFAPTVPRSSIGGEFRWATVINVNPIQIRIDGDTDALPLTPDTLVARSVLRPGSRVWVQFYARRVLILGMARTPVLDQGWITPTLSGSWVEYGGVFTPSGYRLGSDGQVHLRGLVKSGGTGTANPIFTLPDGYRPEFTHLFTVTCAGNPGVARVDVQASGLVFVNSFSTGSSNGFLALDGISFYPNGA